MSPGAGWDVGLGVSRAHPSMSTHLFSLTPAPPAHPDAHTHTHKAEPLTARCPHASNSYPHRHDLLHSPRRGPITSRPHWCTCVCGVTWLTRSVLPQVFTVQFLCNRDYYQPLGFISEQKRQRSVSCVLAGEERFSRIIIIQQRACWTISPIRKTIRSVRVGDEK